MLVLRFTGRLAGRGSAAGDASTNDAPGSDASRDSAPTSDGPSETSIDAANIFLDDFNRADNATIGNGWLTKTSGPFSILGDMVARATPDADSLNYEDNIVYRPSGEDVLDVEIAIEVTFTSYPSGYPQIWARMPSATIGDSNALTGYVFYITSDSAATLSRNSGVNLNDFGNVSFPSALSQGVAYRMRLRVTGTSPVHLVGTVELVSSGALIGQSAYDDTDSTAQLTSAGSVGFSGSNQDGADYTYDNFSRTDL